MCEDHERSSAIVTPRYFNAETLSSSTLCKIYIVLKELNCIAHIFSHCSMHAQSVCRTWPFAFELISRYIAVPSATSLT